MQPNVNQMSLVKLPRVVGHFGEAVCAELLAVQIRMWVLVYVLVLVHKVNGYAHVASV